MGTDIALPDQEPSITDRVDADRHPELLRLLDRGHPVLLVSRWSNASGDAAIAHAVAGLYAAARSLAGLGVDITDLLPADETVLRARAKANLQTVPNTTLDKRPFANRYFFDDRDRSRGLLLLASIGSGRKISAADLHQPTVLDTARRFLKERPGLVYAPEIARFGRTRSAFGPIITALEELHRQFGTGPWVGDADGADDDDGGLPLQPYTDATGTRLLALATRAEAEAKKISRRNLRGKQASGGRMRAGRLEGFGWEFTVPAGWATVRRMDPDTGRRGAQLLYLDQEGPRPQQEECALQLPVTVVDGRPVDQVANVQWLLDHFGPGCDYDACADHLVRGGYSTPGYRRWAGARAAWPRYDAAGRSNGRKICWTVLRNRAVYLNGTWTVHRADGTKVTVTNMFPLYGVWLTTERYDAINDYIAELDSLRRRDRVYTFTGQTAQLGGAPVVLSPRVRRGRGDVVYYLRRADDRRHAPPTRRAAAAPPLPAYDLAVSIAEAVAEHGASLAPLLHPSFDATVARRRSRLGSHRERQQRLTQANARRVPQLDRGSEHFEPSEIARAEIRHALNRDADELITLADQIDELEAQLAAADGHGAPIGLPVDDVLGFLASLRNPADDRYRPVLRSAIRAFTLEVSRHPAAGGLHRRRLAWSFDLLLRQGAECYPVPVRGELTAGAVVVADRVGAAVARLRAGVPVPGALGADWREWYPALRQALGVAGPAQVVWVGNPRLLRLGMAACHPPVPASPGADPAAVPRLAGPPLDATALAELARELGEPLPLLQRLQRVYLRPARGGRWLHLPSTRTAALFAAAIAAGSSVDRAGAAALGLSLGLARGHLRRSRYVTAWELSDPNALHLLPCRCGHPARYPLRLREADGPVCARCRRDGSGITWPVDPYEIYRDQP